MEQPAQPAPEQPQLTGIPHAPTETITAAAQPQPPYPVTVNFDYPEKLSRLSTAFRIILVIPHSFALYFVGIVASILAFIAWLVILFTGKYPRGMFDFVAGYNRWFTRVNAYSSLLTDKHPPYSLK